MTFTRWMQRAGSTRCWRLKHSMRTLLAALLIVTLAGCQNAKPPFTFLNNVKLPDMPKPAQPLSDGAKSALKEGDTALDAGDYAKAKERYLAAQKEAPENLDALEGAGLAELNLGEFVSAVDKFNAVLAKDPKRWRSLNAIAIMHTLKNQLGSAGDFFAAADAASPNNPVVLNNWGLGYAIAGNYPESVRVLERAGTAAADAEVKKETQMNLALVHALNKNDAQALIILRQNLGEAQALKNMAAYTALRGDAAASREYLQRAVAPAMPSIAPQPMQGLGAVVLPERK